jgi:hypothetical protein
MTCSSAPASQQAGIDAALDDAGTQRGLWFVVEIDRADQNMLSGRLGAGPGGKVKQPRDPIRRLAPPTPTDRFGLQIQLIDATDWPHCSARIS